MPRPRLGARLLTRAVGRVIDVGPGAFGEALQGLGRAAQREFDGPHAETQGKQNH